MNKIVLSGGRTQIDEFVEDATIIAKESSVLDIINNNKNRTLSFLIQKDADLTINMFDYARDLSVNLVIEVEDNAKVQINNSFITTGKYELDINTNVYGDNTTVSVDIRGINEQSGIVKVLMNGNIAENTKNNVLNEYAKLINKSDATNVLIPNLIVNTNEVIANHGVSLGTIRDNELFYLTSKGIDKNRAIKLLEEGFILSIMDEVNREKIKNILMGR